MQRHDTAREALPADAGETGRADHVRKRGGLGKFTNRFHKVAIGFRVAGHGAAERRNHLERKQIINPIQPGHVDGGEFQAQQSATVLEHAKRFVEREIDPRHVADAERNGVAVEMAVRESQRFRITLDERHALVEMPRRGARAADSEHIGIDVAYRGPKARARRPGGAERDVAGAAGDVEQRKWRIAARRIERVDHYFFPEPMQAHRHQIVHQVGARRHAVKHIVHQRLLVAQGYVPEAKMRGLVRPIHVFTPFTLASPDHSLPAAMALSRQHLKVNAPSMPELPEVETVRRGLQPVMEGSKIVKADARRKDLRFPFQKDFVARLEGQTVTGLGRRAKYLLADLASGDVLLMHLGMAGSFRVIKDEGEKAPGKFHHPRSYHLAHDHVVFHMSSGAAVVFNDPRRFGYMKVIARKALDDEPLLRGLGPEPLGNEFDARMLARSCANKKTSLKAALLDQRVVAGLGNIYVCEALYRAHLSPRRLAATLATKKGEPTDHAKRLVSAIHAVLNQAIKAGGSSLRDHRQTTGELGYFQHSFQVYDREGEKCQTAGCKGLVRRFTQNGRSTFWCPKCQK